MDQIPALVCMCGNVLIEFLNRIILTQTKLICRKISVVCQMVVRCHSICKSQFVYRIYTYTLVCQRYQKPITSRKKVNRNRNVEKLQSVL